jgi:hypothetical protein
MTNQTNVENYERWNLDRQRDRDGGKHKWITKEIARKLPRIGETSGLPAERVKVALKLFNPTGAGSWFITEANLETGEAFGFADLQMGPGCAELGYLDLNELRAFRGRFGLPIERDEHFTATLAEVIANTN